MRHDDVIRWLPGASLCGELNDTKPGILGGFS